jgi:hypothetical protein
MPNEFLCTRSVLGGADVSGHHFHNHEQAEASGTARYCRYQDRTSRDA